jgi:hypothetical protein
VGVRLSLDHAASAERVRARVASVRREKRAVGRIDGILGFLVGFFLLFSCGDERTNGRNVSKRKSDRQTNETVLKFADFDLNDGENDDDGNGARRGASGGKRAESSGARTRNRGCEDYQRDETGGGGVRDGRFGGFVEARREGYI